MPACPACGSIFTEPVEDDWYGILVTLSDQVPTREHCEEWLDAKGIPGEVIEQVTMSMIASIRYDPKKGVWKRNGSTYLDIWRVAQSWCLNDRKRNGTQPSERGLIRKAGGNY